jgi:hypothetical protein
MNRFWNGAFPSLLILCFSSLLVQTWGTEEKLASTAEPEPPPPSQASSYEFRISTTQRGLASLPKKRPAARTDQKSEPQVPSDALGRAPSSPVSRDLGDEGPDYQGTIIEPNRDAKGETLRVQKRFASLFAGVDPCPKERTAHFDWLPHFVDHPVRNLGWRGNILESKPESEGIWLIKIRLYPSLYSNSLKTLVLDNVEETYRMKGEVVQLVASDASTPKKQYQHFPMAF